LYRVLARLPRQSPIFALVMAQTLLQVQVQAKERTLHYHSANPL
jgi:hypothetical protein